MEPAHRHKCKSRFNEEQIINILEGVEAGRLRSMKGGCQEKLPPAGR